MLAAWEAGLYRGPLDRTLLLLWAGGEGEDAADLPLPERDRRLLALREGAFGPSLECMATCPGCGARIEVPVDARALANLLPRETGAVEIGRRVVALRPLTSRDLAAAHDVAPEVLPAFLRRRLAPDSDAPAEAAAVEAAIEAQAEAAEMRLALTCPECGTEWRDALDIGAHLWAEVEAAALRTMAEVAELARAFGWSEPQVLALSPARRSVYLSLAREGP
jgi:hypothetical protein